MKTNKIIILAFILLSFHSALSQAENKNILIITFYESAVDDSWSKAIVTENDKKIEEARLTPFRLKDVEKNQIEKNSLLTKYIKQGYRLICGTDAGTETRTTFLFITTYVLEK